MAKKQSNTPRALKERRIYRALINAGVEPKTARKYRGNSEKFILEMTGVRIPKKVPKIKEYTKETLSKKRREIIKYQYAREKGLDIKTAQKLKKSSYKFIEERARYITPEKRPREVKYGKSDRDVRQDNWRNWAKEQEFPDFIEREAEKINLKEGFDVNASYGYTVAFYAYIENENIDDWHDRVTADKVTESAVYSYSALIK
ncbi:MAG: hypothetical protein RBR02_10190 [Desulfuromonadaceae bacterium]|nr:hypothetical protein [Desulfuromonadaceae bacterium]